MSERTNHEEPITRAFWEQVTGGTLMYEYKLVKRGHDRSIRLADAVILPDAPKRIAVRSEYPPLVGQNVIVVQTKASRLGMYLMGQTLFSAMLAREHNPACVRSVALRTKADGALCPLMAQFPETEVWVWNGQTFEQVRSEPTAIPFRPRAAVG